MRGKCLPGAKRAGKMNSSRARQHMRLNVSARLGALFILAFALRGVGDAQNGYSYTRTITISHLKVPNSNRTNFPMLFNTTDPLLETTANGGHVSNSSGYDIIFTSDAAGTQKLNHEIEYYNGSTGQFIAWVEVPTVSYTTDTVIYLFYGNSSITASQENKPGVWDSNFLGVWHLSNGTTLNANDSTANGNNATINGATAASGFIDGGASFNGTTSSLSEGATTTTNVSALTVGVWMKAAQATQSSYGTMIVRHGGAATSNWILDTGVQGNKYQFCVGDSTTDHCVASGTL